MGTGFVAGSRVEMIVMDYIEGDDIATHLFKEVIKRHPNTVHLVRDVDVMTFPDLMQAVAEAMGRKVPGGKARDEGAREYEERKVFNENAQQMYLFLKRRGFRLNPIILEQIKKTITAFHDHGIVFRDGHHRNFIVQGSLETPTNPQLPPPQVTVIDYGHSQEFSGSYNPDLYIEENKKFPDDFAIIRELEQLVETFSEKNAFQKSIALLREQLSKKQNKKWISYVAWLTKDIEKGAFNFDSAFATRPDLRLDFFLAAIFELQEKGLFKEDVKEFLKANFEKIPFSDRNKITELLKDE